MKANREIDRLGKLAAAFHKIAQKTPDLRVDLPSARPVGTDAETRPMFRVRLRSSAGEARARMLVHERGAKLETRVGDAKPESADNLPIDLRRGYRWDTATFDDAAHMAEVLYQHMTQRLTATAGEAS